MHHESCLRKRLHHLPGPTRMIEVDMRQQDIIDARLRQAENLQRIECALNRILAAGVDDGDAAILDNQVNRGE